MDKSMQILEMAKIIDDRLIEANNYLGSMNKGNGYLIAQKLIEHYQPKINDNEIVISKKEYETLTDIKALQLQVKDCLNNMSNEDIKQIEAQARKETAREILQELYYEAISNITETIELTILQIEELAEKYGVDLGE